MNTIKIQRKEYFPALDGLRGFATILVILYHYLSTYSFFRFGWIGIELFFVLSGFLISASIIPYANQKNILVKFYRNRFLRIFPLYFLFLLVFFFCWFFFTSTQTQTSHTFYSRHYWQFFLFIQNWAYICDFSQNVDHLQHLWSLAVEEQIYLIYPLFILFFIKRKNDLFTVIISLIILIIISRIFFYVYTKDFLDYKVIYWNTFFRADSFLCGVITYLTFIKNKKAFTNRMIIAGCISLTILISGTVIIQSFEKGLPFFTTIGRTALAMSFCLLMWICVQYPRMSIARFFTFRALMFTGKISYGIFIFHWPIFLTGFTFLNFFLNKIGYTATAGNLMIINIFFSAILTVTLSYLSYKYFESFFLKWKDKYYK